MKANPKILGVLLSLFAVTMVISAASAVNLVNGFDNGDFGIDVLSGNNFTESVNISTNNINLVVFKGEIASFIKDLENGGTKVEETDKYVVLKNTQNSKDFDIVGNFNSIFNFVGSIFSSDGVNISAEGNNISLSSNGLNVSDANGENVSITSEGVTVSGNASSGNETVNVSSDVHSHIEDCNYSIYLKNQDNNKVIVISGNNLELLKAMADSVSFNEN